MNIIKKFNNKIIILKKSVEEYFVDNLTSYTYLFFSQILITAGKDYLKAVSYRYSQTNLLNKYMAIPSIIIAIIVPCVFIVAAVATFKYPKKLNFLTITIFYLNYAILTFLVISALTGSK